MVNIYTADPAALVVNGRMYVYTGHDEASATQQNFVMRDWRVYSSTTPSTDRAVWTDHGSRLSVANFRWAGADAWAAEVEPRDGLVGAVTEPSGLFGFWEAPWIFKRNGLYYLAYASNTGSDCVTSSRFACIRYATATSPLGPWTHRGIVLGQMSSTTNHPAIVELNGQWWIVYHTAGAPGGGNFRRSVAVDRVFFNADGTMRRVVQTS